MRAGSSLRENYIEITGNRGIRSVPHVWDLRRTILWFLALTTGSILLMALLFPENAARYAGQLGTIAAACGVALWLIRRGSLPAAATWLVSVLWVFLAAGAWTSGGLESSAIAGFLVVVALSGLLLGIRAGMVTAAVSMLAFIGLVLAHGAGLLPAHSVTQSAGSRALDLTLFTAILIWIQAVTLAALGRATKQTESDLEARVDARTAELTATVADLEKVNRELDHATRAKSDFLAGMSHELRTPLNSIIGFAGVLESGLAGDLSEEQRRQVGMISASGRRLLGLVNQVLDLSKIESGDLAIGAEEFDIADVARRGLEVVTPLAQAKGVSLVCDVEMESIPVVSDRSLVDQVLLNLLGNAVKFTDEGSVCLRVSRGTDEVVVVVEDTGPGIPDEELPLVFERYYQAAPAEGGKHEGSGLGLYVTREIVAALGGTLDAESESGVGSTFRLTLPLAAQA